MAASYGPGDSASSEDDAGESVGDVADRIDRFGDRFQNAKDSINEAKARSAAAQTRKCGNLSEALEIEAQFLERMGQAATSQAGPAGHKFSKRAYSAGKPAKAKSRGKSGAKRAPKKSSGGRKDRPSYNPGRLPYDDSSIQFGAIGSDDNDMAIFEDEPSGLKALCSWLIQNGADCALDEAIDRLIGPGQEATDIVHRIQQLTGFMPQQAIRDLTETQVQSIAGALGSTDAMMQSNSADPEAMSLSNENDDRSDTEGFDNDSDDGDNDVDAASDDS